MQGWWSNGEGSTAGSAETAPLHAVGAVRSHCLLCAASHRTWNREINHPHNWQQAGGMEQPALVM